jgi:hypothetical protein
MLVFQGCEATDLANMQYPDHFHWYPELFANCGTTPAKIAAVVNNSLYGSVGINNIAAAQVNTNDAVNGLDIRYGVTAKSPIDLFYPSATLANLAMLRFGPIPKPKTISVDLKAIFGTQLRECFMVLAICGSVVYSLFNLYQGTIDANYGYGRNGVWTNNATTRLKTLTATTTYTGTLQISAMPKCFTLGETSCDIAIVRLQQAYWEGTGAGMRNASTLYLKNLEITTK